MVNKPKVNIVTGNHKSPEGIQDYLSVLHQIFTSRGYEVSVTTRLDPSSVNILIDEFTNAHFNMELREFRKQNPKSILILVLTEFIDSHWGVESCNFFSRGLTEAFYRLVSDIVIQGVREDLSCGVGGAILRAVVYLPLMIILGLKHLILMPLKCLYMMLSSFLTQKNYSKRYLFNLFELVVWKEAKQVVYMHMRYLGLIVHMRYFDGIISSHDSLADGYLNSNKFKNQFPTNLGVVRPEIDPELVERRAIRSDSTLCFEITGSVTKYRRRWLKKIKSWKFILGIGALFKEDRVRGFRAEDSLEDLPPAMFSLHPPQTASWKYSSPTRLYRAYCVDMNVPVITKHFEQSPLEDVCLVLENKQDLLRLIEFFENRDLLSAYLMPRIHHYSENAIKSNDRLVSLLLNLYENK